MIQATQVSFRHRNGDILHDISFAVRKGEIFGIIGPNGSGKSTLIRLLSGIEKPTKGEIRIGGKHVHAYSRKALSRLVGVLPQDPLPPVGYSVRDVIGMGRYPYQNWLGQEKEDAGELIERILRELDLADMGDRTLDQLSGGERQRVALGKVMAQQPVLLMLDEPTNSLDIGHQLALMDLIRRWRTESQLTVVAVLHDLNLAAQYCDRLLLLHQGRALKTGTPEEIVNGQLLGEVYGVHPIILRHPANGFPQVLLQPESGVAAPMREQPSAGSRRDVQIWTDVKG